jgi:hypothetical protein
VTTATGQEMIEKHQGTTAAERYLAHLCEQTFLSLWSYPNVFRDALVPGAKIGKEVCDLLVIFEDRVLIFSDKDCAVPRTGSVQLDWSRWFRKAVSESAVQAHGAERYLRQFPDRLFLDRECTKPLPILPQITDRTRFHLIVVAHKIAERYREQFGGSGSLMIRSDLKGTAAHTEPFAIGDINPEKSFVTAISETRYNQDSGEYWEDRSEDGEMTDDALAYHTVELSSTTPLFDEIGVGESITLAVLGESPWDPCAVSNSPFQTGQEVLVFVRQKQLAWRGEQTRAFLMPVGDPRAATLAKGSDGLYYSLPMQQTGAGLSLDDVIDKVRDLRQQY